VTHIDLVNWAICRKFSFIFDHWPRSKGWGPCVVWDRSLEFKSTWYMDKSAIIIRSFIILLTYVGSSMTLRRW